MQVNVAVDDAVKYKGGIEIKDKQLISVEDF